MAMTKKHYSIVAQVVDYTFPLKDYEKVNLVNRLIAEFEKHDSNFNKDKFMKECGL